MPNRRRQPSETPQPVREVRAKGGFRLRHALLLLALGGVGWQLAPRAEAAWTLRERATQLADYALCMAGPTGPTALRDQPEVFRDLIRRRLLSTGAESAPFEGCSDLAAQLTGDPAVRSAHYARAQDFIEYGGRATRLVRGGEATLDDVGVVSLDQLDVSTRPLADLARAAWPFERDGYTRLVKPSSHAKEAPHPLEFPRVAIGSGLPATPALYEASWQDADRWLLARGAADGLSLFETRDGGLRWRGVSINQPGLESHAGRCAASDSINAFTFESLPAASGSEAGGIAVNSWFGDQMQHAARLSEVEGIVAASCDEETALIAVERKGQRSVVACRHAGTCAPVPVPDVWLEGAFDLARVSGINVVASVEFGIVRVRSSRDNGQSWTPATVAFDSQAGAGGSVPSKLTKLGQRLILRAREDSAGGYAMLVSDDHGASWRAPAVTPQAPSQAQPVSQR